MISNDAADVNTIGYNIKKKLVMPSPGKLVHAVAAALQIPEVNVGSHYRALREAGLLTKSGRGRSAAETTVLDAARILVGVMASPTVKESAYRTQVFAAFRRFEGADASEPEEFPELRGLAPFARLDDTLAALIAAEVTYWHSIQKRDGGENVDVLEPTFETFAVAQKSAVATIELQGPASRLKLHFAHAGHDLEISDDPSVQAEYLALTAGATGGLQTVMQIENDVLAGLAHSFLIGEQD